MKLQLAVNNKTADSYEAELQYLKDHYHDYAPEEWEAQYTLAVETSILEDQLRARRKELMKQKMQLL